MAEKFCASYSGGKDSALALYRRIQAGHQPIALITTMNRQVGRSWFHGVDGALLERVAERVGIPVWPVACDGADYEEAFASALEKARAQGATECVFGDIDIEDHKTWGEGLCARAGLRAVYPLWQEDRLTLTRAFIDSGFSALIKAVNKSFPLPASMLGKKLTYELIDEIAALGADPCGENGEYHSFVYDGPLFSSPVPFSEDGVYESEYAYSLILNAK